MRVSCWLIFSSSSDVSESDTNAGIPLGLDASLGGDACAQCCSDGLGVSCCCCLQVADVCVLVVMTETEPDTTAGAGTGKDWKMS